MRATVSFPYDIVHLPRHILYLELCQKEVNTRIRMGSAVAWIVAIVAIVATARAGAHADVGGGRRPDFRPRAPA